ncbi:putative cytochrome P450 6a13 isoform X1 [Lasioglossum baleicum]|uniref:putative cytochrome P450 6a13 isoform X1 n=1 Tax=Lasioglossum baleicum TaxID=434251 RepID=UPI003FCC9969
MENYLEFFCGVVVLLIALYYYRISHYDFWSKRGVFGPKPHPIFGNLFDLSFARISAADAIVDIYKTYKHEPVVGLFEGTSPILVINDPDIIKNVMIRDFSSFQERPYTAHGRTEPMSQHLFRLDARKWRPLRPKITPIFTSGKLREMFALMVECSKNLEGYLDNVVGKGEPVKVSELSAQYTTDVVGTCAFGINMNSMSEKESEFRRMGRSMFNTTVESVLRLKTSLLWPKFYDLLGFVVPEKTLTRFFTKIVMNAIKYREEHGIHRPDFINMLMEFRNHPEQIEGVELTDTLLAALAAGFFGAGFETSSSSISWTLYELAQNHEIQDKLHAEIKAYHIKYGDTFTVNSLNELKYLDKVFKEILRKYPAGAIIQRRTTSACTFDTLKFTLPKQIAVWIPLFAIHRDPEIYPDPEKFDPERFSEEQVATRHPMHYLPFGDGPRSCIASRFAQLQAKLGLIKILRNHKVDVCEKTMIPCEYEKGAILLQPKGGIYLNITKME